MEFPNCPNFDLFLGGNVAPFHQGPGSSQGLCHGLQQLLLELAVPAPFRPNDALRSLGLDSFQMGRLARAVQRQFRVEIPVPWVPWGRLG
jgi:hypothetical protein